MPIELQDQAPGRAVLSLFRSFGAGSRCNAEACQHATATAMHPAEQLVLAWLVPVSVWVVAFSMLDRWMHPLAASLLAIPAGFLLINLLPCVLAAKSPAMQWSLWLGSFVVWSVFHRGEGGLVGWVAWFWIGIFFLSALACLLLILKRSMSGKGKRALAWRLFLLVAGHAFALAAGWQWGWHWALAGGFLIAAGYCFTVLRPASQWLGEVLVCHHGRETWITIDDGPDPVDTPQLLDLLDHHAVKAVFFMIGNKVVAHPELAREVVARGHEIGNHTMTHPQASFWCAGPWRTAREMEDCQKAIEAATGFRPRWFRAPVGHRNWFTHPVAGILGLRVMGWNRRGYDAVATDARKVLDRILPDLTPGDIILLHEATPIAAEVLSGVLEHLSNDCSKSEIRNQDAGGV